MSQGVQSNQAPTESRQKRTAVAHRRKLREAVSLVFAELCEQPVSNNDLYDRVARKVGLSDDVMSALSPVGQSGRCKASLPRREVRWAQQTLKLDGMLERVGNATWQMTAKGKSLLTPQRPGRVMIAFCTRLGVALWGDARQVARSITEPIHLYLSSPPYALAKPRHYGQVHPREYTDWLCLQLEPIVERLAEGASIALNLGNDCFRPGTPARHSLTERLVVALEDRFGLYRMDTLIWSNPSKAPGPIAWASKTRQQLNTGYETIIWMTNCPERCRADNRRVLRPHSRKHLRLVANGGCPKEEYGDGAYNARRAAYHSAGAGAIPKNVLTIPTPCAEQRSLRAIAEAIGLPSHGATFPLDLPLFLIEFMTEEGDLVVDTHAGTGQVMLAADILGRRSVIGELHGEYLGISAVRQQYRLGNALIAPAMRDWLQARRASGDATL